MLKVLVGFGFELSDNEQKGALKGSEEFLKGGIGLFGLANGLLAVITMLVIQTMGITSDNFDAIKEHWEIITNFLYYNADYQVRDVDKVAGILGFVVPLVSYVLAAIVWGLGLTAMGAKSLKYFVALGNEFLWTDAALPPAFSFTNYLHSGIFGMVIAPVIALIFTGFLSALGLTEYGFTMIHAALNFVDNWFFDDGPSREPARTTADNKPVDQSNPAGRLSALGWLLQIPQLLLSSLRFLLQGGLIGHTAFWIITPGCFILSFIGNMQSINLIRYLDATFFNYNREEAAKAWKHLTTGPWYYHLRHVNVISILAVMSTAALLLTYYVAIKIPLSTAYVIFKRFYECTLEKLYRCLCSRRFDSALEKLNQLKHYTITHPTANSNHVNPSHDPSPALHAPLDSKADINQTIKTYFQQNKFWRGFKEDLYRIFSIRFKALPERIVDALIKYRQDEILRQKNSLTHENINDVKDIQLDQINITHTTENVDESKEENVVKYKVAGLPATLPRLAKFFEEGNTSLSNLRQSYKNLDDKEFETEVVVTLRNAFTLLGAGSNNSDHSHKPSHPNDSSHATNGNNASSDTTSSKDPFGPFQLPR